MNRLLLISLVTLLHLNIIAQPLKIELALQSGLSVPMLEYAHKNLDKGSFALIGFTAGAELKGHFYKGFGAFVQSGITLNPVDVGDLGYEKMQADPFLMKLYIRSDPYRVIHLLGGFSYQHQLIDKIKLEGQLGAGTFFSSTPYQLHKTEYFLMGPPYFEITSSRDVSFAYGAGLRAIYEANQYYQVALSSGFKRSKAEFGFYSGNVYRTDVRYISLFDVSFTLILKLYGN